MKLIDETAVRWFRWMGALGLILSILTFFLYVFGVIPGGSARALSPAPFPSPADSAALWEDSSAEYLQVTGIVFSRGWFLHPLNAYLFSTAALALLASTALPTLLALAVLWFRRRDYLYGGMALIISAVLIIAVAG